MAWAWAFPARIVTTSRSEWNKLMFKEAWKQRLAQAQHAASSLKSKLVKNEKQIEQLLDRVVEAENPTVIGAYEKRIAQLEKQKLITIEKLENKGNPKHTFDEMFELALNFLSTPWNLWASGQMHLRKTVLRLTFAERLAYRRGEGF